MDSEARAGQEGAASAMGGSGQRASSASEAVRFAAVASDRVEVRPVEFVVTASEEWTLPREGTSRLQLRNRSGHVRQIRLAPAEGEEIRVHVVREAWGASDAEARSLLAEMKIERRREGDARVLEMSWPYAPRRRRAGPHSYTNDDPRAVALEIHLPRGVRLDVSNAILTGANLSGAGLMEANMTGNDLSHLKLSGADLTDADLSNARVDGLNLSGARLNRAHLAGR